MGSYCGENKTEKLKNLIINVISFTYILGIVLFDSWDAIDFCFPLWFTINTLYNKCVLWNSVFNWNEIINII